MATIDLTFTEEELQSEEWRVTKINPNYEVSDLGRVRRCTFGKNTFPGRILKAAPYGKGYYSVGIDPQKLNSRCYIHILVAAVFIGPCPLGYSVNHEDGVKANNRATNLNYKTHQENMEHAGEHGLMRSGKDHWSRLNPEKVARNERHGSRTKPESRAKGEGHGMSKLTEPEVRAILAEYDAGRRVIVIARERGISKACVYNILSKKSWHHL